MNKNSSSDEAQQQQPKQTLNHPLSMILMPSKTPIPTTNQPPHPINPPLRPPPQQHLQSRIHNLRLTLTEPLKNFQPRLKPTPLLPAHIIPRRLLNPVLRVVEPLDAQLAPFVGFHESVRHVFETVDVGAS